MPPGRLPTCHAPSRQPPYIECPDPARPPPPQCPGDPGWPASDVASGQLLAGPDGCLTWSSFAVYDYKWWSQVAVSSAARYGRSAGPGARPASAQNSLRLSSQARFVKASQLSPCWSPARDRGMHPRASPTLLS